MKAESSGTLAQTLDALWSEQQNTVAFHFLAAWPWIVLPSACIPGLLLFSAGVGVWQLGAPCVVTMGQPIIGDSPALRELLGAPNGSRPVT